MGLLVDGVWQDDVSRTKDGHFIRPTTRFRNWVTPDGSPGPSGEGGFAAEAGRYHLYVSLACPWAHRTVIFRKLKGLENVISLSAVSPDMLRDGWTFNVAEGSTGDTVNGKSKLSEIYLLADPKYSGRVSVPVLWDKNRKTIVNNELPEIIRMLNSAFDAFTNVHTDFYPAPLRGEIDRRQRARLCQHQQRRLSRRFRHRASGLRGRVPQRVRRARRDRAAACATPLSRRATRSPKPTGGCSRR